MPQPVNAISNLSTLLDRWVETAFDSTTRDAEALNQLWFALADLLCSGGPEGSQGPRLTVFIQEMINKRKTPQKGYAPTTALQQRIHELLETGLREFFIVLAIRHALDQLIGEHFPTQRIIWGNLADQLLPPSFQTLRAANEAQSGFRTFGPTS